MVVELRCWHRVKIGRAGTALRPGQLHPKVQPPRLERCKVVHGCLGGRVLVRCTHCKSMGAGLVCNGARRMLALPLLRVASAPRGFFSHIRVCGPTLTGCQSISDVEPLKEGCCRVAKRS